MHNMFWDHSWAEVNRSLCPIYTRLLALVLLLPITLKVAWQLLLVSYNAKVIQLPCYNASCKGAYGALHKWLCWEFRVSTIAFVLLPLFLDVCLTCCRTILYLINRTL